MHSKIRYFLITIIFICYSSFSFSAEAQAATKKPYISAKKITLSVGKTKKLSIRRNTRKVNWKSSNTRVVIVSKSGKIKAKKAGRATITATIKKKKYRCRVIVTPKSRSNTHSVTQNTFSNSATQTSTTSASSPSSGKQPSTTHSKSNSTEASTMNPSNRDQGWSSGWY